MRLFMPLKTTSRPSNQQALSKAVQHLTKHNISSAWLEAEILLAWVLKKPRSFVLSHGEHVLTTSQATQYQKAIKQRIKYYPLAYITGHKEFYGLDFLVTPDVLIPRPESELMVENALKIIKRSKEKTSLIDIGTGSGCLLITVLKQLRKNSSIQSLGFDISTTALQVAKKNAKRHSIEKNIFIKSNLLEVLLKKTLLIKDCQRIIILANLPYVTRKEIQKEISIHYEPKLALDGGKKGLELYKKLSQQITKLHNQLMVPITIICEINPHQKANFAKIWPHKVIFKKDLAKKIRIGIIGIY